MRMSGGEHGRGRDGGGEGADDRGGVVWRAVQALAREILRRKPGAHLLEGRLPILDLSLELPLGGRAEEAATFAASLAATIERQIDDAIEEQAAFTPGHAWCHRCEAAACDHSRPPSSRHVFLGYAPTGAPRWMEFAQYGLEARLEGFDRLYADPQAFLTVVMDRADLYGTLLQSFRSEARDLLGQVVAGFFPVASRTSEGRGLAALTFQAIARDNGHGRRRVGLNILGTAPDGAALDALWDTAGDLPWRRALRWAQAALSSAARQAHARHAPHRSPEGPGAAARQTLERRVQGILLGLARRLEQEMRGRGRRTTHAGERHEAGERPTRKALDDTRTAAPEAFLVDERSGAVVVLGERGRTHFFGPDGRLVSSVRYSRDAIERKRRQGLWRPLPVAEARAARETLLRGGKDSAPDTV
jgi:hypothetical protein